MSYRNCEIINCQNELWFQEGVLLLMKVFNWAIMEEMII